MKKPTKQFRKYIKRVCQRLREKLFLHEWEMNIEYGCDHHGNKEEIPAAAHIDIQTDYLAFSICFHKLCGEMFAKGDEYALSRAIVHEFCHILTEPLYRIAIDSINNTQHKGLEEIRERQTQRIANVLWDMIDKKIFKIEKKKDASHKPKKR